MKIFEILLVYVLLTRFFNGTSYKTSVPNSFWWRSYKRWCIDILIILLKKKKYYFLNYYYWHAILLFWFMFIIFYNFFLKQIPTKLMCFSRLWSPTFLFKSILFFFFFFPPIKATRPFDLASVCYSYIYI